MGRTILIALLLIASAASAASTVPTEPGIYNPYVSTDTTMFFHINGLQQFPINTQSPDDRYAEVPGRGAANHSGCVEDPAGAQHFTDQSSHTWYGYSSPSIVEYDVDDDGGPRIHTERGLSYDVELDIEKDAVFTWYLQGKSISPFGAPDGVPVEPESYPMVNPQVVVRATIREGDDISVLDTAFNQGKLVAIGESMPTTLMGAATMNNEHVTTHEVDGRYVYEFTFPLTYDTDEIAQEEGYNIRVDAFVENPYCNEPENENSIMFDFARIHTSSDFRPKLQWAIMNPLYIEMLHPQFVGDDLVVHTMINSPWGSYDVLGDLAHERPLGFAIDGPSPVLSLERIVVDHTKGHGPEYHFLPVQATWLWDYAADQAEDGIYTVTLHVQNDQESADAYGIATFQLGSGQVCHPDETGEVACSTTPTTATNVESPGVPTLTLLVALLGFALVRRK